MLNKAPLSLSTTTKVDIPHGTKVPVLNCAPLPYVYNGTSEQSDGYIS